VPQVLWIGGAQWAGKSTVANLLAARYPIVRYAYDYHDARSHSQRACDNPDRFPAFAHFLADLHADPDHAWVDPSPAEMAGRTRAIFAERFEMVIEDLAALPGDATVLAEGWGLRPEMVAPRLADPDQAVFLVPSDDFRRRQLEQLGRAQALSTTGLSNPERAQQNRVERDRLLAEDVVASARANGLPLLVVDGTCDAGAVTGAVEEQFRPFLPERLY
jgi:hypothetical protein